MRCNKVWWVRGARPDSVYEERDKKWSSRDDQRWGSEGVKEEREEKRAEGDSAPAWDHSWSWDSGVGQILSRQEHKQSLPRSGSGQCPAMSHQKHTQPHKHNHTNAARGKGTVSREGNLHREDYSKIHLERSKVRNEGGHSEALISTGSRKRKHKGTATPQFATQETETEHYASLSSIFYLVVFKMI